MELAPWQQDHKDVIHQFLKQMNTVSSSFILKGGTALMECYGLDRFSEDIDLDASRVKLHGFIDDFCKSSGYSYRIAKDTPTVNRFMIDYGSPMNKRLKVEISYRNMLICYICNQYLSYLKESTINQVKDAFSYKGFDNFDYITRNESDPFIDKEHLADSYLKAFDRLGLLYTNDEKLEIQPNGKPLNL